MKQVIIAGNIGKDAVARTTQGGDKVTSFRVAVEDRQGREKSTIWFDVSIWGQRGEKLAQYLTKGCKVTVAGDLGRREHDGKTYFTVKADQITLMGGGQDEQPRGQSHAPRAADNYEDEVPF